MQNNDHCALINQGQMTDFVRMTYQQIFTQYNKNFDMKTISNCNNNTYYCNDVLQVTADDAS